MIHLIRYLFFYGNIRDKLPKLRHTLANDFKPSELDPDVQLILMTGRVRDPEEVKALMEKHGVRTAYELLPYLPKQKKRDWHKRLHNWLRHLEGSYQSDPHPAEIRRYHDDL